MMYFVRIFLILVGFFWGRVSMMFLVLWCRVLFVCVFYLFKLLFGVIMYVLISFFGCSVFGLGGSGNVLDDLVLGGVNVESGR